MFTAQKPYLDDTNFDLETWGEFFFFYKVYTENQPKKPKVKKSVTVNFADLAPYFSFRQSSVYLDQYYFITFIACRCNDRFVTSVNHWIFSWKWNNYSRQACRHREFTKHLFNLNSILGCTMNRVVGRLRKVIHPLCSALVRHIWSGGFSSRLPRTGKIWT